MSKPVVTTIITDLDNTLFDWFGAWHASFSAMLKVLSEESGISENELLSEIKEIHKKYGTSEYAFLIEEIPSLQNKYRNENLAQRFDKAIRAYRKARRATLKRYPGVIGTLLSLRSRGCLIIGYTESMAYYSNYRIRQLEFDGVLDYLFSPSDHDLPENLTREQIRLYPATAYELKYTVHKHTPPGELKPNPKVLLDIVESVGAIPNEACYIGDNLWKDMSMAQQAGIHDVHAAYGTVHTREDYSLLVKVTHWSDEDVKKEKELKSTTVNPTYVLDKNFSQMLEFFDFKPFYANRSFISEAGQKDQVEIWKSTVEVQKHFNEIEMKIRNLALAVSGAILTASGFVLEKKINFVFFGQKATAAPGLLYLGAIVLLGFWFMDKHWYHRLLYGAVKHGEKIEKKLRDVGVVCELTNKIGAESPIIFCRRRLHSNHKIDLFYGVLGLVLTTGASLLVNTWFGVLVVFLWLGLGVIWLCGIKPDPRISGTTSCERICKLVEYLISIVGKLRNRY